MSCVYTSLQDVVENQMKNASWKALWIVKQHDWNERKWEESIISILGTLVPDLFLLHSPKGKGKIFLWKFVLLIFCLFLPLLTQVLSEAQSFHKGRDSKVQRPSQAASAAWFAAGGLQSAGLNALTQPGSKDTPSTDVKALFKGPSPACVYTHWQFHIDLALFPTVLSEGEGCSYFGLKYPAHPHPSPFNY